MENILNRADKIVNERNEECDRQYGPFNESMEKVAKMTSLMSNKNITTEDCFNVLISLKLIRQSYNDKQDNLLDCVAYIGALDNYKKEKNPDRK